MLICWICCPILFGVQYQFNISNFIHQCVFITLKALRCDNNWGCLLNLHWLLCASDWFGGEVGFWNSEGSSLLKQWNNKYTVYIQTIDGTASCRHILQLFLPTNDIKPCWAKERSVLEASVDQHIWCVQPRSPKCGRAKIVTKGQLDNACTGFFSHKLWFVVIIPPF